MVKIGRLLRTAVHGVDLRATRPVELLTPGGSAHRTVGRIGVNHRNQLRRAEVHHNLSSVGIVIRETEKITQQPTFARHDTVVEPPHRDARSDGPVVAHGQLRVTSRIGTRRPHDGREFPSAADMLRFHDICRPGLKNGQEQQADPACFFHHFDSYRLRSVCPSAPNARERGLCATPTVL